MVLLMKAKRSHNPLISAIVGRAQGVFLANLVLSVRHFNGENVLWRVVLVYFYSAVVMLKCGLTV